MDGGASWPDHGMRKKCRNTLHILMKMESGDHYGRFGPTLPSPSGAKSGGKSSSDTPAPLEPTRNALSSVGLAEP
jgi:hypothetical protein